MELGRCREKLHDVDFYKARMEVSGRAARQNRLSWTGKSWGTSLLCRRRDPRGLPLVVGNTGAGP